MRCTCDAAEWAHHHVFGGTLPCEGFVSCKRCQAHDEKLWRDELEPRQKQKPRVVRPTRQAQLGREYVRRRYGNQTAAILYGQQQPETD